MHRIIHTFKKILQLLFNRIFYVAVALMLQLAWLMITVWRLAAYSKYISNAIAIISVLVVYPKNLVTPVSCSIFAA